MKQSQMLRLSILILSIFIAIQVTFTLLPALFIPWSSQVMDHMTRLKYQLYGAADVSPNIVHIDINDSSLKQIPPDMDSQVLLTELLKKLKSLGVSAVAVDMLFPRCIHASDCEALVQAVAVSGNVYLPVILTADTESADPNPTILPTDLYPFKKQQDNSPATEEEMQIAFQNYRELNESAAGLGHITGSPDSDGVFRRFPLLHRVDGSYTYSLSTLMLADYLSVKQSSILWLDNNDLHLPRAQFPDGRVIDINIPLDDQGRLLLNFPGPWNDSFYHYSAAHILQLEEDTNAFYDMLDELEGALVVLSDVTTGSRDFGPIALQNIYPLSGIHATIANDILLQSFLRAASPAQETLMSLILILILLFSVWRFHSTGFSAMVFIILLVLVLTVFYSYVHWNIEFNLLRNGLSVLAVLAWVNGKKYIIQEKEKAVILAQFGNYLAPEVLKKVLHSPGDLKHLDRKYLTILFSDIVGFTAWSANKPPEVVHRTLSEYFATMTEIAFRYNGTVDKFIGDGLLVFFGDPLETPDHAQQAVLAANEMQQAALALQKKWLAEHGLHLEIRIGINSGEVIVGNLGSKEHMDYTVIGANVNLAQRLENRAPAGGILISVSVAKKLQPSIPVKSVGSIHVKGFKKGIDVFEVLPENDEVVTNNNKNSE
jgi:adenylate cyclase